MQDLEIPYRVVAIAVDDLGASAAKKFDFEAWLPGQGRYRELTSCSNTTDYQARRLDIRYRPADGRPAHLATLNGTAVAVGRTIIALLENGQREDGSVELPAVLAGSGRRRCCRPPRVVLAARSRRGTCVGGMGGLTARLGRSWAGALRRPGIATNLVAARFADFSMPHMARQIPIARVCRLSRSRTAARVRQHAAGAGWTQAPQATHPAHAMAPPPPRDQKKAPHRGAERSARVGDGPQRGRASVLEYYQRGARGPAGGDPGPKADTEGVPRAHEAARGVRVIARGGLGDGGGEAGPALGLGVGRNEQLGDGAVDRGLLGDAQQRLGLAGHGLDRQRRVDDQEGVLAGRTASSRASSSRPSPHECRRGPSGRGEPLGEGAAQWPQNQSQVDGGVKPTFNESQCRSLDHGRKRTNGSPFPCLLPPLRRKSTRGIG